MAQIFLSHTKKDKKFCDRFDIAAARVGIKVFRSEFEKFEYPPWKTIKNEISKSSALFLIIGSELIDNQKKSDYSWKFTQNWISYEVGIACQLGIDIWVICENKKLNFPVPFLNNYHIMNVEKTNDIDWLRVVFQKYAENSHYTTGINSDIAVMCPNLGCGAFYNFHTILKKETLIICPSCLKKMRIRSSLIS